jgi:hypothetical protein
MTKISYIAGVGASESAQRAQGIKPAAFVPYLSLTRGEMALSLMLEQAKILAGYYGTPKYKEAATMLENALTNGVHGTTPHFGALGPDLYGVARAINQARRQSAPASGAGFSRIGQIRKGVNIGEIIPLDKRLSDCQKAVIAKKLPISKQTAALADCERAFKIESILNEGLESNGQYLAYGFLPNQGINGLPNKAADKIQDQLLAMQSLANVGKFNLELLAQWLNVGLMRSNVEVAKIEPYGWAATNSYLTMMPEAGVQAFQQLFSSAQKWTDTKMLGNKMTAIVNQYQIGSDFIEIGKAILQAIKWLFGKISEFAKKLKAEQDQAFAAVKGFGLLSFGPEDGDWDKYKDPEPNITPTESGISTPLLLGGAALAFFALK